MNTAPIFIALVLGFSFIDNSSQYVSSPTCFGQVCPASTTTCKEHKKSSPDRSKIQIKISCLDDFDASVKEYYFEEPSNMDPYTFYENTKLESINEGISHSPDPYRMQPIDLTPRHQSLGSEW